MERLGGRRVEALFKQLTIYIASGVEVLAALVIGLAVLQASIEALALYLHLPPQRPKVEIRLKLGQWLALALEFTVAADILRTAVAPSWDDIGKLAAIIFLRTALNFFLQREVDKAEESTLATTAA
jgi:uncharacterized membrane protein